jgi:hypothetical protein
LGFISDDKLQEALTEQVNDELSNKPHRHIGKILIEKGWISYNQALKISDRIKKIEQDKNPLIKTIQYNLRILNSIILLILIVNLLLIIKIVFTVIDYIPSVSIIVLLAIVSGLVVISFYFAKKISLNAINDLIEYSNKMDILIISLEHELNERR